MTSFVHTPFLKQLICPIDDRKQRIPSAKPNVDLDTCELTTQVQVGRIQPTDATDQEQLGAKSKGIFSGKPNDNLHDAAKSGLANEAKQAIADGADIRYRKNNRTALDAAISSFHENSTKVNSRTTLSEEKQRCYIVVLGCQQIISDLQQIARKKLLESIQQAHPGRVVEVKH
ncbi:unnamed protein product [Didymodactylos carnosus]|uniref:Uncharacterized protein n=1 Tax=Didymodactylos carnosus TaxID=1234261 RepID=A0A814RAB4_9BILA|nr:unnamed protein product [Didymodactylos carnosus]CAF3894186.1 unnamed protein product [Didymodactylos carnosus]